VSDAESLARGLGPEAVATLLKILRRSRPADVHVLLGPVRGKGRRSVEVVMVETIKAMGEGDAISVDSAQA
jgi:hypothetical protein